MRRILINFSKRDDGRWDVSSPDMANLLTYYDSLDEAIEDVPLVVMDLLECEGNIKINTNQAIEFQPIIPSYQCHHQLQKN